MNSGKHRRETTAVFQPTSAYRRDEPADLVALAHLVHAPGEGAKRGQEDGHRAGPGIGDPSGIPDWSEATGRRAVLEERHVFHASHPWLLPYHRFRHLCSVGE